jgi:hypothetical protein
MAYFLLIEQETDIEGCVYECGTIDPAVASLAAELLTSHPGSRGNGKVCPEAHNETSYARGDCCARDELSFETLDACSIEFTM